MCAPALPALLVASTAISAAGAGFGALQASAQNRYAAKIADRNADLANDATRQEMENTRESALQLGRRTAAIRGQQRAAMAANGVDLSFGSAADVLADTDMLGREDLGRLYRQGDQNVRGLDIQASNYRSEAAASRQAATGSLIGGVFDVGSTALGGATQYAKLKATGAFGSVPKADPVLSSGFSGVKLSGLRY